MDIRNSEGTRPEDPFPCMEMAAANRVASPGVAQKATCPSLCVFICFPFVISLVLSLLIKVANVEYQHE